MLQFLRNNAVYPTLDEKLEVRNQFLKILGTIHFEKQSYAKKKLYFHYDRYLNNKPVESTGCMVELEEVDVTYLGIQLKFSTDDLYDLSDIYDKPFNCNWSMEYGSWAYGLRIYKDKKDEFYLEFSYYDSESEQEFAVFEPFDSEILFEFMALLINFEADLGCSNMFGNLIPNNE